jgi:DNA-binding NarL/FixJ family response regulator
MTKPRILLIDDDSMFRDFLEELLGTERVELEWASNGAAGLEMARERLYELVLLDYQLPDMLGTEALDRLSEGALECPVIMLTGYGSINVAVEAMKKGAEDFFTKPLVDTVAFVRFLNRTLRLDPPLPLPPAAPPASPAGPPREASLAELIAARQPLPPERVREFCARLEPSVALSGRECEVVAALLQGLSNKEIAAALFLSERTIKNHLTRVYERFGVDSRPQLFNRVMSSLA